MSNDKTQSIIEKISAELDIPDSAYEKAERRYKDVGEWFASPGRLSSAHDPHVYPQGSFRLGTVIRPLNPDDSYDLDMGCRLRTGISKTTHSQYDLKSLVRSDLEAYRQARGISHSLVEKHRCWRLKYADELNFHMDVVPSIPADDHSKGQIREAMLFSRASIDLSTKAAALTGAITDNTDKNYRVISPAWRLSNSEGYALWFESQMRRSMPYLESRAMLLNMSKIDVVPIYRWKSPLQRCVQLLKRHRNVMFKDNDDNKPISIIITTLAGLAYEGEPDIGEALTGILSRMDSFVGASKPRIPNPVNPKEDFADKWYDNPRLEKSFNLWLVQARHDFGVIMGSESSQEVVNFANRRLNVPLAEKDIASLYQNTGNSIPPQANATEISSNPARPWCSSY